MAKHSRSQSSLEFLVTYGWAIVVVLIVIGVLSYFMVPYNKVSPPKCLFASGISCLGTKVNTTEALIVVRNVGEPIMYGVQVLSPGISCVTPNAWVMDATYNITCNIIPLNVEDRVKIPLIINYTREINGFPHMISGEFFNYVS
jgi:uncharacterized protein (UPF0333 family)